MPVILDAKRGDIGSTAEQYAREAFERYGADAVTLSPFMGFDSIEPYLRHDGKGADPAVPHLQPGRRRPAGASAWPSRRAAVRAHRAAGRRRRGTATASSGLVVGATYPAEIARVRELAPTLPLLIPGIGAQGGDAGATVRAGWRAPDAPIIVNSSRAVLYAGAPAPTSPTPRARAAAGHARRSCSGAPLRRGAPP